MHILDIKDCDLKNGDGIRVSIWFAGCEHKCPGCQNPQTWNDEGKNFDDYKDYLKSKVDRPEIQGITLTGGDPMFTKNRAEMLGFVKSFKETFPNKDIWCYTGYTYEQLLNDESAKDILQYVDVLVDRPYLEGCRNVDLKWRGSMNQRVIDVPASLEKGEVVLFCS